MRSGSPCSAARERRVWNPAWCWKPRGLAHDLVELDGGWAVLVHPSILGSAARGTRTLCGGARRRARTARSDHPIRRRCDRRRDLWRGAAAHGLLRRNSIVRRRLVGLGRAGRAFRRRRRVVACGNGADLAFGSGPLARQSAVRHRHRQLGEPDIRPGARLGQHPRCGRARQLRRHAGFAVLASRSRRFHRRVRGIGAARRLCMASATHAARAVPVSLGAVVRRGVSARFPGRRERARRCTRPCAGIRSRDRDRLAVRARRSSTQPLPRLAARRGRGRPGVDPGGMDPRSAPSGGGA